VGAAAKMDGRRWLKPVFVGQLSSSSGLQPITCGPADFMGLRDDKKPKDVRRGFTRGSGRLVAPSYKAHIGPGATVTS
jgi:hypothetical protein